MGIATLLRYFRFVARPVIGRRVEPAAALLAQYPELSRPRWRLGGLPVRIGGWCLGRRTVSGITLGRTIWLAPDVELSGELLLHEFRHVEQFEANATFPLAYLWQSLRHGYVRNRFEQDARAYAARRMRES